MENGDVDEHASASGAVEPPPLPSFHRTPQRSADAVRRERRLYLLIGLGGAFLVVAVFGGGGFGAYYWMTGRIESVADPFYSAYDRADYDALLGIVTSDWDKTQSIEETRTSFRCIRTVLGASKDRSLISGTPALTVPILYFVEFERDAGQVMLTYAREKGVYRLADVYFDTPALDKALVCSACGHENDFVERCASCGRLLPWAENASSLEAEESAP